MSNLLSQEKEATMNIAMNSVDTSMSTLALFGRGIGAEKPAFSVDISPAGQALFNQDSVRTDAIMPATGVNETLKAALICMLLS
jgi:hypothetical protein